MPATIFQIEDGRFALKLVDTADTGYADSWQAPDGKTLLDVVFADYDSTATTWSCQVTSGALTASPNTNDVTVPATFCQASSVVPQPGITSYSLDGEFLQDVNVITGLSRYLFETRHRGGLFLPRARRRQPTQSGRSAQVDRRQLRWGGP